jgi:hypothetical protein
MKFRQGIRLLASNSVFNMTLEKEFTGSSRLSRVMEGRKVTNNPKPQLKQKQSKHDTELS